MKRTTKLIVGILLAAILAVPVSALTHDSYILGEYLKEESNRLKDQPVVQQYTLTYYKDAEMTEAYGDLSEIPTDETVYYSIVPDEGCYIKWIKADADYMDAEKIIFGRHEPAMIEVNCVLTGDINSDNKVSLSDISTVLKLMSVEYYDYSEQMVAADFNGDGKFNLSDVTVLMKYIAKWDIELSSRSEGEYEIYCRMDTAETNNFFDAVTNHDPVFYKCAVIRSTEELSLYISEHLDEYGIITSEKMDSGFYAEDVKSEFDDEFFKDNELVVFYHSDGTAAGEMYAENVNGKLRIVLERTATDVVSFSNVHHKFITVPKSVGIDLDSGIEVCYRSENRVGARYLKMYFEEEFYSELLEVWHK